LRNETSASTKSAEGVYIEEISLSKLF
jgi:hypothetical protein